MQTNSYLKYKVLGLILRLKSSRLEENNGALLDSIMLLGCAIKGVRKGVVISDVIVCCKVLFKEFVVLVVKESNDGDIILFFH